MVAGRPAPVTCTGGASGGDALLQPFVSVLPPVPEQCAAWPMYVSAPSVKMKFAVHWAPSVNVWTPGWIVAVAAGAQADAAEGAMASAATAAAAARSRRCMGLPPGSVVRRLKRGRAPELALRGAPPGR